MRNNLLTLSLLLVSLCPSSTRAVEDLQRTWTLYHSMDPKLGDGGFTPRGVVTLQADDGALQLTAENDANGFSAAQVATMMASGWYQVKLVEQNGGGAAVMTTVPACQLRRANFRDEISLAFGQQGHVISVAYSPLVSPLAPKTCDELAPLADDDAPIQFTTKVEYETAVPGMSLKTILPSYQPPPGLKFIPGGNKAKGQAGTGGGDAKPEGFQQDKPEAEAPAGIMGFFQRYWYIILPIFLMNMISTEPEQQQQQGQQGGGAAGQGGGGQPAAAPAARGGGGGAPKRRGKRG